MNINTNMLNWRNTYNIVVSKNLKAKFKLIDMV